MKLHDSQITGSLDVSGSVTASAFSGDGSAITGVTAEWDGTHTGNATISQTLTVNNLSSSGDVVVAGNLKDSVEGTTYINLSSGKLSFQSNGEMLSIKSGSTTTGVIPTIFLFFNISSSTNFFVESERTDPEVGLIAT